VYAAEKLIKENADKIPDDKKKAIETETEELKQTLKGDDLEKVKSQTERLQESLQAASAEMYKATAEEAQQQETAGGGDDKRDNDSSTVDGPVVDAEIVDEKSKKHEGADLGNQWCYNLDGTECGPVDEAEIIRLIQEREAPPGMPVCKEGEDKWLPARDHACFQVEVYPKRKRKKPVRDTEVVDEEKK